jgi:hypothetical protein
VLPQAARPCRRRARSLPYIRPARRRHARLTQTAVLRTLIVEQDREPTRYTRVRNVRVPTFIYGTAWKEDDTARLARMALDAGFRGIDTANQRRHYHQAGVGEALAGALPAGGLRREDVFLQTKFTHVGGQDHRLPYDPRAPFGSPAPPRPPDVPLGAAVASVTIRPLRSEPLGRRSAALLTSAPAMMRGRGQWVRSSRSSLPKL